MKPRIYSSTGIILARSRFGEADRIITIFTKDFGKLSFIAKGVRRPKSRKRGHLEVFNHIKFSAASGKGFDTLVEAEIIDNFSDLRKDLRRVSVLYYFVEVINRSLEEEASNQDIFNLLLSNIRALSASRNLKKMRLDFAVEVLEKLGFWPKGFGLKDPDKKLEEVIERKLGSIRVGRKLTT